MPENEVPAEELPKDDFDDPDAVEHADQSVDALPGSIS